MMQESPRGSGDSWFARALHGREGFIPSVAAVCVVLGVLFVVWLLLMERFPANFGTQQTEQDPRSVLDAVAALSNDTPPLEERQEILGEMTTLREESSSPELSYDQKQQLLDSLSQ